jgi:hypothetical protein
MDNGDEPSSIIIDTKITNGVPIMSKKQRESFIRRNQGRDSDPDEDDIDGRKGRDSPKQSKKVNIKA